jgi:tRNA(Ile)-lysidine synthetase-like protein
MDKLFTFWFENNDKYQAFWFDGSRDQEIYHLFNNLLLEAENISLDNILLLTSKDQLCYIILYDQITRNISRITNDDEYRNDHKAIHIAKHLCDIDYDLCINFLQRIFILMPFRHTNMTHHLDFVISRLNVYENFNENKSDYNRFYLATLKSYTNKIDEIQLITNNTHQIDKMPLCDEYIHDYDCNSYNFIQSNVFIQDINKNALYKDIIEYIKKYRIQKLGVSLSGGVDSMVLLTLLHQMILRKELQQVVAIHIDYKFRKESTDEAKFLVNICLHLNIPLVLREIMHFTSFQQSLKNPKIQIQRDFVEEETKQIRFNAYKYAINMFHLDGICLGHHKGDIIENVFMNFSCGKNLLNLFVMEEYSLNNDVYIMRPMLKQEKNIILEIAQQNNILYFKDTTPDWSFRGNIRRKIFPAIACFDPAIINNLFAMGEQSKEWQNIVKKKLIDPILQNIQDEKYGFIVKFQTNYNDMTISYWTEIFINIFHKRQTKMISQKNVKGFIEWTNKISKSDTLYRLSNEYMVFCDSEFNIYFLKMCIYDKLRIDLAENKMIVDENIGRIKMSDWNIEIKTNNFQYTTNQYMTYENILKGEYKYYIKKTQDSKLYVSATESHKDTFHKFKNIRLLTHIIPKVYGEKKLCDNDDNWIEIIMKL